MNELHIVYLSIGSNLGDRISNIEKSFKLITEKIGEIVLSAPIYENPPIGFESTELFLNTCIGIETTLSPNQLLIKTQEIEIELGRTNKSTAQNYSSRIIDLDIIFYDELIIENKNLTIPHKHFRNRNFVLKPLNDITPDLRDPISGFTIQYLHTICKDKSELTLLNQFKS